MRWIALMLGLSLSLALSAQEVPAKKKKPALKQTEMKAHQKPTREQIRKFNELEKKK